MNILFSDPILVVDGLGHDGDVPSGETLLRGAMLWRTWKI